MSRLVRLLVAYQGTRYHGWQRQPQGPSIQQTLEDAYTRMTGLTVRMAASGRTDAGVHAAGLVVCAQDESRHDPAALAKGLNALLPEDIVVIEAQEAPPGFNPRRQAVGKHYRYVIHNQAVRPLFDRHLCWHLRASLDVEAMSRAAAVLIGEHDFSAFRASGCEAKSPVRRVDAIRMDFEPPRLHLDVFGNGFLKQMVRNIVGTCVEIGRGSMPGDQMATILAGRDREQAGPTAPACGLTLNHVYYAEEEYRRALEG